MKTIKITALILCILVLMISMISCSKKPEYYTEIPTPDQVFDDIDYTFETNPLIKDIIINKVEITDSHHSKFSNTFTADFVVNEQYTFVITYKLITIEEDHVSVKRWVMESIKEVL